MFEMIIAHKYSWKRLIVSYIFLLVGLILLSLKNPFISNLMFFLFTGLALLIQFDREKLKRMFDKLEPTYTFDISGKSVTFNKFSMILTTTFSGYIIAMLLNILLTKVGLSSNAHVAFDKPYQLLNELPYMWIGLIGEELLKCCILFPMFSLLSRKYTVLKAFIFSAFITNSIFGMLHFGAYGWNLPQLLLMIGLPSIIWYVALYKTQSLRSVIAIHITHDYIVFSAALLLIYLN